ncbi:phospholipase DDHD2 isoform X1 [Microplitis mediator]|uniref:phospholipase DDHD2 isoform X1 n=1 Tax=Microplitis mediator TaxID=375433 RepID=UPI00255535A4|nr:phospholipase DDHD2 isoform X1 [Microplitis mediator]
MSDLTRKIKNPLLTAAGQGFPFEEHEIPNLLIPVAQPVLTSTSIIQDGNANPTSVFPSGDTNVLSTIELNDNRDGSNNIITKTETLSEISLNDQTYDDNFSNSKNIVESIDNLNINPITPPLTLPSLTNVQNSNYRLGNQRRLRYVPPPNLTSSIQAPTLQPPINQSLTSNLPPSLNTQDIFIPPQPQNQNIDDKLTSVPLNDFTQPKLPHHQVPHQETIPALNINPAQQSSTNLTHQSSGLSNYFSIPPSSSKDDLFNYKYENQSQVTPKNLFTDSNQLPVQSPYNLIKENPGFAPLTAENKNSVFTANDVLRDNSLNKSSIDVKSNSESYLNTEITVPFVQDETDNEKRNLINTETLPSIQTYQESIRTSDSLENQSNYPFIYNPTSYNLPTCQVSASPTFSFDSTTSPSVFTTASDRQAVEQPAFINCMMPEPTGTATLNPTQISVSQLAPGRVHTETIIPSSLEKLATSATKIMTYRPVYYHWFNCREIENKIIWHPFSMHDSLKLEEVFNSTEIDADTKVATDGGRYDVEIVKRQRSPVYWSATPTQVRRCSWFYKGPSESRYTPYEESVAARLEEEYKQACLSDSWNRRIELNNNEHIIFHSSTIQVHYMPVTSPEFNSSWSNTYAVSNKPKVVKRGVDEFNIDDGEPEKVDHLLFLVHGIGSACDLKFRSVEEVVDEFRSISLQLVQTHYRTASIHGAVNRIEVLPISWHSTLHSEDTGIDNKLKTITLESIPKLRHFTNDTLLDILFYTSPVYCQTIMQTVGNEMNKLYALFKERNSQFDGSVYLGGHSLGSLILFDLLCHQKPIAEKPREDVTSTDEYENSEDEDTVGEMQTIPRAKYQRRTSRRISYVMGSAGTGQPFIVYPHLNFYPKAFFAFGSPVGMFVTTRGIDTLGENFRLPTCPAFFNIFHPFDPVAYRIEPMVNNEAYKYRPQLIPHHKGRKRMHLELKETMARVGADLKQKILNSMKSTWNSVYQLTMFYQPDNKVLEQEIDKVVEEEFKKSSRLAESSVNSNNDNDDNSESSARYYHEDRLSDDGEINIKMGKLNGGRRIDYVLQEAPFEYINEYIFALTSHVCYWESEDTMLLILKEIYGTNGIQADAQMPQQLLTPTSVSFSSTESLSSPLSEHPSASTSVLASHSTTPPLQGVDPTAPITQKSVGPPPKSGFVRKS